MLKSNDERIVINDFIKGEPLSAQNLDDVLDLVTEINKRYNFQKTESEKPYKIRVSEGENTDRFRLLFPNKNIWLYSGYRFNDIFSDGIYSGVYLTKDCTGWKRREIIKQCTVMIDGKYIDSQRDISLAYRGSKNQRVIDCQQSMQKGEIILWKC